MEVIAGIYQAGEEVRLEFAPDPRTAIFELGVHREDGELVVYGASSSPAAVEALHARIGALGPGVRVRDAIVRLPDGLAGAPHAIVAAATAPMLAGPVISESHLSQIPLGNRLRVLREQGRWCQCRSADGYLGWVHRGYVERVEESQARAWEAGTSAPVHYCLEGRVLAPDGEVLVRLPWGARIGVTGDTAHLPDGRRGRLEGSTVAVSEMPDRFPLEGEAIAETASLWCGAPYLWGGTTVWGVDCSGLVQTIYRMHGLELPRDSDQQAALGEAVSHGGPFESLQAGDLLFFAEGEDPISHVAISLGGSRIIHSSLGNGGVRTNDVAGAAGYERELRDLLVTVRRVIRGRGS